MRVIDSIWLWVKRISLILVLVGVVGFITLGIVAKLTTPESPPTVSQAPWAIVTATRTYYGQSFKMDGSTPELKGYWWSDGKKYHFVNDIKEFDRALWGEVAIIYRGK